MINNKEKQNENPVETKKRIIKGSNKSLRFWLERVLADLAFAG